MKGEHTLFLVVQLLGIVLFMVLLGVAIVAPWHLLEVVGAVVCFFAAVGLGLWQSQVAFRNILGGPGLALLAELGLMAYLPLTNAWPARVVGQFRIVL